MSVLAKREWINRGEINTEELYKIAAEYSFSLPFSAILQKRNINIKNLLNDNLMYSPYMLPDMDKAINIILEKIKSEKKAKIAIVNDYDVDGATSGVILKEALDYMGADSFIITPNRDIDGYGISIRIIDEVINNGCNFIITTDNGISATEQIKYAKDKGITVIITDHHEVPFEINEMGNRVEILPNADAIIDQKRNISNYPFRDICGAMIAYKVAEVLIGTIPAIHPEEKERLINRWSELAGIGTICDVMPLVSENRTIVKKAIELIKNGSSYIGIRQLIKVQCIDVSKFNAYNIGFGIGPCINACGRMTGSVDLAIALLLEKNSIKAEKLANEVKQLNDERKKLSLKAEEEALNMVESMASNIGIYILYMKNSSPHIMGIVAGRIKEATGHPCICLTDDKDDILKGSGRSVDGYNMFEKLSMHKELYESFGGHELAAGISFKKKNLEEITRLLNDDIKDIDPEVFIKKTQVDLYIDFDKISKEFINEINTLEPFGTDNPKPILAITDTVITKISRMGANKNYIKLQLEKNNNKFDAVHFGNAELFDEAIKGKYGEAALKELYAGKTVVNMDFLYSPSINVWNNKESIQFLINDYR